jgi:hypothetical protein
MVDTPPSESTASVSTDGSRRGSRQSGSGRSKTSGSARPSSIRAALMLAPPMSQPMIGGIKPIDELTN